MITVADLRPLDLFDGLTDDQLGQLVEAGHRGCGGARHGRVPRGRAGRLLVGTAGREPRPGPADRPGGHGGGPDGPARALGGRVPGLGRARRLSGYGARPDPRPVAAHPLDGAAGAVGPVVSVRRPSDRGPLPHGPRHRGDRPTAQRPDDPGHAGGRAGPRDQQPGRGGDPGRRCPDQHVRDGRRSSSPPWPAGTSRRTSSRRWRCCAASSARSPTTPTRWPGRTRSRSWPTGSAGRTSTRPGPWPGRWPPPGSMSAGAAGRPTRARRPRAGAGADLGGRERPRPRPC